MTELLASAGYENWLKIGTFVGFLGVVIAISLFKSRKEESSEDYFLAGRKLTWWLIGFSLIASNISTEQFVGMNGSAFSSAGLAIASYEWMSAVVLVLVAWFFLPRFLKAGIYTMPEYLEYRYDKGARTIMAIILMVLYVAVFLAAVLWSGATYLVDYFEIGRLVERQFNVDYDTALFYARWAGVWAIALVGAAYTIFGGLSAVVWADLIQGSALIIGGCIITCLGLAMLGDGNIATGWSNVVNHTATNAKLNAIRPWNDPNMSWIAIFVGGMWIPNIFYWGLNQFITQRTLGAKSVHEGQKGVLFAAFLKILMPLAVAIPGVLAFYIVETRGNLTIASNDSCYSSFMKYVLEGHGWLIGLMIAAICGAVMSSFNAGINSASTVFTMDLYSKYINKNATSKQQLKVGRRAAVIIVIAACLWTPIITKFDGVFQYIQEIWGFISPGIVAVFVVGMLSKRVPRKTAKYMLLLGVVLYGGCRIPNWSLSSKHDQMGDWQNEKSNIISDKHYAEKKLALITDKNFKDDLKKAIIFTSLNSKFRRPLERTNDKAFADIKVEKIDLDKLTDACYKWTQEKDADGNSKSISTFEFTPAKGDTEAEDKIRTAMVYNFVKHFAPKKFAKGKTFADYKKNSDLLSMAFGYAKKLKSLGFKMNSKMSNFADADAFLKKVKAGDIEAINALAGYTAEFPAYGHYFNTTFLHHMLFVCLVLVAIMLIAGVIAPNKTPIEMPKTNIDTTVKPIIYVLGCVVIVAVASVYYYFYSITQ